jgi:hypothetical protein
VDPWPEPGVTLTHDASVVAVQAHSRAASTRSDPLPPPWTNVVAFELTLVWHFVSEGATTAVSVSAPPQPIAPVRRSVARKRRRATVLRCARVLPFEFEFRFER